MLLCDDSLKTHKVQDPLSVVHVYLIINTIGTIWVSKNQCLVASEALLIIQDICTVLIDVTEDQW